MSEHEDRENRLAQLLGEALSAESPEAELLARYAEDRTSLADEELRLVEEYFDASPAHRDQLRVLESFDLTGVLTQSEADLSATQAPGRVLAPVVHLRDRINSGSPWLWAPAALAAAAALVLLWQLPGSIPTSPIPSIAPEVQVAFDPAPPLPTPPSSPRLQVGLPEVDSPEIATTGQPNAEVLASGEPPSNEDRIDPASVASMPESSGVVAEGIAQTAVGAQEWDPLEGNPPPPGMPLREPDDAPVAEPVLLAMLDPIYASPSGAAGRIVMGDVLRNIGPANQTRLRIAAPHHVGYSATASPALVWSLSGTPPAGTRLTLFVLDKASIDPLVEQTLSIPHHSGWQRTELANFGAALKVGIEYRWLIVLSPAPANPAEDQTATGFVEYVPAGDAMTHRSREAEPHERAATWAAGGYWYDAVADLDALARAHPNNDSVKGALQSLLEQSRAEPEQP